MNAIISAIVGSFLITLGQVLWKIAIDKNGGLLNPAFTIGKNFSNIFSSPYMISGLLIYAFATLLWMYLLGKYQYSYIYPLFSMAYIFSFLFAIFLFGEEVSIYKWLGIILIICGVFLIGSNK